MNISDIFSLKVSLINNSEIENTATWYEMNKDSKKASFQGFDQAPKWATRSAEDYIKYLNLHRGYNGGKLNIRARK